MRSNEHLTICCILFSFAFWVWAAVGISQTPDSQSTGIYSHKRLRLTQETASGFAHIALKCIQKEYPNKLDHVMNDAYEVQSPKALHPAFYGCFDWHSAVHGHWMSVRLLRLFPDLPEANEIRTTLNENLSAENILTEVEYLKQENRRSFERTYGWAWLLKLAEELHNWDDPDGRRWSKNLEPLAEALVDGYLDFFPKQTYSYTQGCACQQCIWACFRPGLCTCDYKR